MKKVFLCVALVAMFVSCDKGNDAPSHNYEDWIEVHTEQGQLQANMEKMQVDFSYVQKLKITGNLNQKDYTFIVDRCGRGLSVIDLSETQIEEIPKNAFSEAQLTAKEIYLPSTLISIGERAFAGAYLYKVHFPINSKLKSIGKRAFYYCMTNEISIPASVEVIEDGAFENCSYLSQVNIESGSKLRVIGSDASNSRGVFQHCQDLKSLYLSNCTYLTSIGANTFYNCSSLEAIYLDGCISLEKIGYWAFASCRNLSIFDASSCSSLDMFGDGAFAFCESLTSFKIGAVTPPKLDDEYPHSFFYYLPENAVLRVPSACINDYKNTEGWNSFTTILPL